MTPKNVPIVRGFALRRVTFYFIKAIKISPYVDITQHNGLRGRTENEVKSTKLEVTVKNICRAALED